jgi:hypothetical protein
MALNVKQDLWLSKGNKNRMGTADEIAQSVCFLLGNSLINGTVLEI